jgi:alkanesulfonate monooxygenase SsuD/methylene tetrahydromethanopterin reductase-like flavin-dependent oxidoreductase (luciferase family)
MEVGTGDVAGHVGLPALGVGTPLGFGIAAPDLVAHAVEADRAGLDDVSVGELRSTEVFALAAAMAGATERIGIETSIVAAVTRAPTLIAMGAATLAQLSGGRFRLGIGAGSPLVAAWHGADFSGPLGRVERAVDVVRAVLAGDRVDELAGFRLAPEMVTGSTGRTGRVPVVLAAMNGGMLRLAGRKADGVVLQFCGPEQAARMAEVVRTARHEAGVEGDIEITVNVFGYGGDDRDEGLTAFRREVGPYLAVSTYRAAAVALSSEAAVDRAAAAWRAGGRAAAAETVPPELADALLFDLGALDSVRARLEAYARAGCDRVRVVPLTPVPGDPANARAVVTKLAAVRSTGPRPVARAT